MYLDLVFIMETVLPSVSKAEEILEAKAVVGTVVISLQLSSCCSVVCNVCRSVDGT